MSADSGAVTLSIGAGMDLEQNHDTTRGTQHSAPTRTLVTDAPVPVPLAYIANECPIAELHTGDGAGRILALLSLQNARSAASLTFTHNITPSSSKCTLHRELRLQSER